MGHDRAKHCARDCSPWGGGLTAFSLSRLLRIDVIVCFFLLGALVGPHGLHLADDSPTLHLLAEIGLAFFLYEVGAHLSLKKVRSEWRSFFVVGPLYTLGICGSVSWIGLLVGLSPTAALVAAATVSLSSTAVALKIVEARGEGNTPVGRTALSVLLFQDVFAVILLALVPALRSETESLFFIVGKKLLLTTAAFVFVILFGRKLLQPFFRWVFQQQAEEVFTGAALFIVLMVSWCVSPLGLSLPLGAFLAGVALSETNYTYLVQAELRPFRGLLLSLFFVAVGMSLDVRFLVENVGVLIVLTLVLSVLKLIVGAGVFWGTGLARSQAVRTGALLAQGSEFGFAIVAAMLASSFLSEGKASLFTGSMGLSLAIAPAFVMLGDLLAGRFALSEISEDVANPCHQKEIIFVEFREITQAMAGALSAEQIPYRIHDRDWERIARAKSLGFPAYFSNIDRPRTLTRASLGGVRAVVVVTEDERIAFGLQEGLSQLDTPVPAIFATSNAQIFEALLRRGEESVYFLGRDSAEVVLRDLLVTTGHDMGWAAEVVARMRDRTTNAVSYSELALSEKGLSTVKPLLLCGRY